MTAMKWYTVQRGAGGKVLCRVTDGVNGYELPHLVRHSPTGFEYGYGGSGPSDLARSIVGDVLGLADPDPRLYQSFKMAWVATLQGKGPHIITEEEVRSMLSAAMGVEGD